MSGRGDVIAWFTGIFILGVMLFAMWCVYVNPQRAAASDLNPQWSQATMRDYLAGQCAVGLRNDKESPATTARRCYAFADAMLMERVKP